MNMQEIKSYITTMKLHIDQIENWMVQASQMVYDLEEKIMDIEDAEFKSKNYICKNNFDFLTMSVESRSGAQNIRT